MVPDLAAIPAASGTTVPISTLLLHHARRPRQGSTIGPPVRSAAPIPQRPAALISQRTAAPGAPRGAASPRPSRPAMPRLAAKSGWFRVPWSAISTRTRVLLVICLVASAVLLGPIATPPAGAAEVVAPFDYYRYQGEYDSGADAKWNCEVTTTTMAIQLVRAGLRVPVKDVRAIFGISGATTSADAKRALRYWNVRTNDIDTIDQVVDAVRRGNVVIVGLMMSAIPKGEDYETPRSPANQRTGRYAPYIGAHSILVRGISADGQWLTVHDPNHWDGNPAYLYADGTPKGKSRLYRTSDVAAGMRQLVDFPRAIEILGGSGQLVNNAVPAATTTAKPAESASPAAPAPAGKPAPRQAGDLIALVSGGRWSSAVLSFVVKNGGDGPITFESVGARGSRPDGKPFETTQKNITLAAGEERQISLLLETPNNGEWQVKQLVYTIGGTAYDLPADGRQNKATFRIGDPTGVAPRGATPTAGLKPDGTNLPG